MALLLALKGRLVELPLKAWTGDAARLGLAGVIGSVAAWVPSTLVSWPSGVVGLIVQIVGPGLLGLALFGLIGKAMGVAEVEAMGRLLMRRVRSR